MDELAHGQSHEMEPVNVDEALCSPEEKSDGQGRVTTVPRSAGSFETGIEIFFAMLSRGEWISHNETSGTEVSFPFFFQSLLIADISSTKPRESTEPTPLAPGELSRLKPCLFA